jgi:predicted nucleic acid-binding protein
MIVTDASVVVELLLRTEASARIADRLLDPEETLHAPHLLDVEVARALRRYALAGDITPRIGEQGLADLLDLPIVHHPHTLLIPGSGSFAGPSRRTTPRTWRLPRCWGRRC